VTGAVLDINLFSSSILSHPSENFLKPKGWKPWRRSSWCEALRNVVRSDCGRPDESEYFEVPPWHISFLRAILKHFPHFLIHFGPFHWLQMPSICKLAHISLQNCDFKVESGTKFAQEVLCYSLDEGSARWNSCGCAGEDSAWNKRYPSLYSSIDTSLRKKELYQYTYSVRTAQ